MSDRIVTPIDREAFAKAQHAFAAKYGTPHLVPGTKDYDKKRKEWLALYKKHGGKVDSGKTFQNAVPGDCVEPCPVKNQIESVDFLDGDAALAAAGVQHVNLPEDAKLVDGARITSLDRLGRKLRVRVQFHRPKKERFKVALLAHNANATYTPKEQGARPAFRCDRAAANPEHRHGSFDQYHGAAPVFSGTTDGHGVAIIEDFFEITAAGGDKYELVAWDVNGNVVFSSASIETKRTLFYATFLGDDPNHVRVNQAWFRGQLEATYRAHHIELVWIGTENLAGIVYHDTLISLTAVKAIRDKAKAQNSALGRPYDDYRPYILKFAFVDHCANALLKKIQPVRHAGASAGTVIHVPLFVHDAAARAKDPAFDWRKCLWRGLGETLDERNRTGTGHPWFKSATLTIHAADGDRQVALADTDLTLVPRSAAAPDAIVEVTIVAPASVPDNTDVTVNLEVVIVNRSVLGQSMTGEDAGTTLQPARSMFESVPQNNQLSSAIHECGHAVGMVATEALRGLQHAFQYTCNGSHCWHAIAGPAAAPEDYHKLPLKDTGDCVMYGLIPDGAPNMAFCADCAAVLRKLDLSGGYTG